MVAASRKGPPTPYPLVQIPRGTPPRTYTEARDRWVLNNPYNAQGPLEVDRFSDADCLGRSESRVSAPEACVRQGGDIREGNSRTGTICPRRGKLFCAATGGDLIRD
jgi:hypothetical protein